MRLFLTPSTMYARTLWKLLGSGDEDMVLTVKPDSLVDIAGVSSNFSPITKATREGQQIVAKAEKVSQIWLCFDTFYDTYLAYQALSMAATSPVFVMFIPCLDDAMVKRALDTQQPAKKFLATHLTGCENLTAAAYTLRKPLNAFKNALGISNKALPHLEARDLRLLGFVNAANRVDDAGSPKVSLEWSLDLANVVGSANTDGYIEGAFEKFLTLKHAGYVTYGPHAQVQSYLEAYARWYSEQGRHRKQYVFHQNLTKTNVTTFTDVKYDLAKLPQPLQKVAFSLFHHSQLAFLDSCPSSEVDASSADYILHLAGFDIAGLTVLRESRLVFGKSHMRTYDLGSLLMSCFGNQSLSFWEGFDLFKMTAAQAEGVVSYLSSSFVTPEAVDGCSKCSMARKGLSVKKGKVSLTCICGEEPANTSAALVTSFVPTTRKLWCDSCKQPTMFDVKATEQCCTTCQTTTRRF